MFKMRARTWYASLSCTAQRNDQLRSHRHPRSATAVASAVVTTIVPAIAVVDSSGCNVALAKAQHHIPRACGAKATVAASLPPARASGSGPRPYRHGLPLPPTTTAPPPSRVERRGRRCSTWHAAGAKGDTGRAPRGPSPRMQERVYKGWFKRASGVEPSAPRRASPPPSLTDSAARSGARQPRPPPTAAQPLHTLAAACHDARAPAASTIGPVLSSHRFGAPASPLCLPDPPQGGGRPIGPDTAQLAP